MKRIFLILLIIPIVSGCAWKQTKDADDGFEDGVYFARCNLKAADGYYISWISWQEPWEFIPVGKSIEVKKLGKKAEIVDPENGKKYVLAIGGSDVKYLMKFISTEPVDVTGFPEEVQGSIRATVARPGMTKEQVYIAMGPPVWAGTNTHIMTYEDILQQDYWIYKKKKVGKHINIYFDFQTGLVNRVVGLE